MPHRLQKSNAVDSENQTKYKSKVYQLNDELTKHSVQLITTALERGHYYYHHHQYYYHHY